MLNFNFFFKKYINYKNIYSLRVTYIQQWLCGLYRDVNYFKNTFIPTIFRKYLSRIKLLEIYIIISFIIKKNKNKLISNTTSVLVLFIIIYNCIYILNLMKINYNNLLEYYINVIYNFFLYNYKLNYYCIVMYKKNTQITLYIYILNTFYSIVNKVVSTVCITVYFYIFKTAYFIISTIFNPIKTFILLNYYFFDKSYIYVILLSIGSFLPKFEVYVILENIDYKPLNNLVFYIQKYSYFFYNNLIFDSYIQFIYNMIFEHRIYMEYGVNCRDLYLFNFNKYTSSYFFNFNKNIQISLYTIPWFLNTKYTILGNYYIINTVVYYIYKYTTSMFNLNLYDIYLFLDTINIYKYYSGGSSNTINNIKINITPNCITNLNFSMFYIFNVYDTIIIIISYLLFRFIKTNNSTSVFLVSILLLLSFSYISILKGPEPYTYFFIIAELTSLLILLVVTLSRSSKKKNNYIMYKLIMILVLIFLLFKNYNYNKPLFFNFNNSLYNNSYNDFKLIFFQIILKFENLILLLFFISIFSLISIFILKKNDKNFFFKKYNNLRLSKASIGLVRNTLIKKWF